MTDRVHEIKFLDWNLEKWVQVQFEQGFSSFFAIFDDFSKFLSAHFEKLSNMAKKLVKNEEKPCSNLPENPFFG